MRQGLLAVIIPTYNGADLLRRYLPSITECVQGWGEAIVVDDASTDGSVDFVRSQFPDVKIIARVQNGGFSAAVNDGIRATDSEFVLVLNNDVEVTPGLLDSILPLFEDESVFAVSPRIVLPSRGGLDEGPTTGFWHHGIFYTGQRCSLSSGHSRGVIPILYATGCAAVYRRSMLEGLGGFDETYSPFYWEDADLGYRAWKRGWKTLYQPASEVLHQHGASVSKFDPTFTSRIKARNAFFFIWRNIEDKKLLATHRRWIPLVVIRRLVARDKAFIRGFVDAARRRREMLDARARDSVHRRLSDIEIFEMLGIRCR
jgi:GT2 family glycosyltransferase